MFVACGGEKENKVYVIGTNAEYPPFEYMEDGKIVGLDAEIIEEKIVSHFYKDEDGSIYLIDPCDNGESFCVVRYKNLKEYLNNIKGEETSLITPQKTYDEAHQLLIELANKLNYTPIDIKEETNGF